MNLKVYFHEPHTKWTIFHTFKKYYLYLCSIYDDLEVIYCNDKYNGNPGGLFSPHIMTIQNKHNKKYIIISYWDRLLDLNHNLLDFKPENCVAIYTSSGVPYHLDNLFFDVIPFSYLTYSLDFELLSLNSKPIHEKENNCLKFRGYLYNERLALKNEGKINITSEKIHELNYFDELNNNKINLSLNGVAEICNRDIEILSSRSVLLRPTLTQKFHNQLIPNFHYVDFEYDTNPKIQSEIIVNKFNEIKNDIDYLKFISDNGYEWFKNNGTVDANLKILTEIVDLKKIK
jgi:hypothetical protein